MGEAYLDWQNKSGGIKLNDVIEEYRYVANGKSVKKGDLLTYVGEDVAPAIEPPFNAVALSSGEGAPEFVEGEVTKTGNIFPTSWNEVSSLEYVSDGVTLSASSLYPNTYKLYYACDGNRNTSYVSLSDTRSRYEYVLLEFDEPRKISKMNIRLEAEDRISSDYYSIVIQGSNNNREWVDLFSIPLSDINQYESEITLQNTDYYKQYRIYAYVKKSYLQVYVWETSEYIEKGQIPSTEHNEQVKIARVYKEVVVTKTGNIFPISGWNEEVANTKYSTNDGYVLEASTSATQSSDFPVYQASDGTTSTWWRSGNLMSSWIKIKLPAPTKITKMKTYINEYSSGTFTQALIQGSNDDSTWTTLSNITSIQSKLTEIVLNDKVDYYQFYRIKFNLSSSSEVNVMEWQTSEYIEKEVIQ